MTDPQRVPRREPADIAQAHLAAIIGRAGELADRIRTARDGQPAAVVTGLLLQARMHLDDAARTLPDPPAPTPLT